MLAYLGVRRQAEDGVPAEDDSPGGVGQEVPDHQGPAVVRREQQAGVGPAPGETSHSGLGGGGDTVLEGGGRERGGRREEEGGSREGGGGRITANLQGKCEGGRLVLPFPDPDTISPISLY